MQTEIWSHTEEGYIPVDPDEFVTPFFQAHELACQGTGKIRLAPNVGIRLSYLRLTWGKPLSLNSACRTPEHNQRVGGHPRSLHLTEGERSLLGCCAFDVNWRDWDGEEKRHFVAHCEQQGWSCGLHPGFCHIDMRREYAGLPRATFKYESWEGYYE